MKKYYVFLFSLITQICISQNIDYIQNYHKLILQGEELIVESNYDSALLFYEKAFNNVSYAFCSDYIVASRIAYKIKKNNTAIRFLDSAVVRGVNPYDKEYEKYFTNNDNKKSHIDSLYTKIKQKGIYNIDKKTVGIIDSLYLIDQKYRSLNTDKEINWELLDEIDSLNAICLKKLFKNRSLEIRKIGHEAYFKVTIMILHKLFSDENFMFFCYQNGFIDKHIYYYAVSRKSLQNKEESKYITMSKEKQKILSKNLLRKQDGIIEIDKLKKLKKIGKKNKFPQLYVQ